MLFSDGVFYDPDDRLFKMWYMGGYSQNTCYAMSPDGIAWNKPALDVVQGTNIVTKRKSGFVDGVARSRRARSGAALQDGTAGTTTIWSCWRRPTASTGAMWDAPG